LLLYSQFARRVRRHPVTRAVRRPTQRVGPKGASTATIRAAPVREPARLAAPSRDFDSIASFSCMNFLAADKAKPPPPKCPTEPGPRP
jgi:hypothetical protein